MAFVGLSDVVHGRLVKVAGTSFFESLIQNGRTAADAYARVPHKTLKDYLQSLEGFDLKAPDPVFQATYATKLTLLRGDDRLRYACEPGERFLGSKTVGAQHETATIDVPLVAGRTYRIVATGSVTYAGQVATHQYDALYCFAGPGCGTPIHFNKQLLAFFLQGGADPLPEDSSGWFAIDELDDLPGGLPHDGSQTYTARFTAPQDGKLVLHTVINYGEDDASNFSGSYTVQISVSSGRGCARG